MELYAGLDLHSKNTYIGIRDDAFDHRNLSVEALEKLSKEEYLVLAAQANLDPINILNQRIKRLEKAIIQKVKLNIGFRQLLTVPGIGNILARLSCWESVRSSAFQRSVTLLPTVSACHRSGCPTVKAKGVATVKTAIAT